MAPFRARGVPSLVMFLTILSVFAACSAAPAATPGGSPAATGSIPAASVNPVELEAASAVVKSANLADADSIAAVEGIRFTPSGTDAARTILESNPTGDLLWAATWVYASSGTDPKVLTPLLGNPDPSIRVMAAAALVAAGDRSGYAILSASLADTGTFRGSRPIISIAGFAASTLSSYVEAGDAPARPADEADVAAVVPLWTTWLSAHEKSLQFDRASGTWKLG
jgi:hypothetical protein